MKAIILLWVVAGLISFSCMSFAADLNQPYAVTRQEWLEYDLFKSLKTETDAFKDRLALRITIEKDKTNTDNIRIAIFVPNAENISGETLRQYRDHIRSVAGSILKKYPWAKDIKLMVNYI
jgi:hypothetical protein